jgi:hypothetical protein
MKHEPVKNVRKREGKVIVTDEYLGNKIARYKKLYLQQYIYI